MPALTQVLSLLAQLSVVLQDHVHVEGLPVGGACSRPVYWLPSFAISIPRLFLLMPWLPCQLSPSQPQVWTIPEVPYNLSLSSPSNPLSFLHFMSQEHSYQIKPLQQNFLCVTFLLGNLKCAPLSSTQEIKYSLLGTAGRTEHILVITYLSSVVS